MKHWEGVVPLIAIPCPHSSIFHLGVAVLFSSFFLQPLIKLCSLSIVLITQAKPISIPQLGLEM